jgi:hypothetical protein
MIEAMRRAQDPGDEAVVVKVVQEQDHIQAQTAESLETAASFLERGPDSRLSCGVEQQGLSPIWCARIVLSVDLLPEARRAVLLIDGLEERVAVVVVVARHVGLQNLGCNCVRCDRNPVLPEAPAVPAANSR